MHGRSVWLPSDYPFVAIATPAGEIGSLDVAHSVTHASPKSLIELLEAMYGVHEQGWFVLSLSRLWRM
jgi:hypothetical protein